MRRNNRIVLLVTWILGIICAGVSCGALIAYTNSDDFINPIDKIRAVNFPNGFVIGDEEIESETSIEIDSVMPPEKRASMIISNGKDTVVNLVIKDHAKAPVTSDEPKAKSVETQVKVTSDSITTEK